MAEVARTADEHVGGHLYRRSRKKKKGERGIAGKRAKSGEITAVARQRVGKYVQSHPVKCHSWRRKKDFRRSLEGLKINLYLEA